MHKPYQKMISVLLISLILGIANISYADQSTFNAGFDQGIKTASSQQRSAMDAMRNFKPKDVIKNYSDNPKEINYKNNPDAIKSDAVSARDNDPTGKAIKDSISNHPKFDIKADSKLIQNITKRADDIYDVVTGQYGDCTKKTSCNTTYKTETCEETPRSTYQYCKKTLNIDLIPHQVDTHYYLTAQLSVDEHNYAGISVNTVNGHINFLGPHDASFRLEGRLPSNIDCHTLQGKIISQQGRSHLDSISFPSCSNGLGLDFHISSGHNMVLKLDIVSSTITYEPQDRWKDECIGLSKIASCTLKEERCTAPRSTHDIQGIPVTRDCWETEATYHCGGGDGVSACEPLRSRGCEQIDSQCKNTSDGGCTLYQQTFRCPIKECTDIGMICNGQTYCLDGDCVKQEKQADPDFQKAVSALSAANEAAKSFTNFNSIFAGVKKTCDKLALQFLNCCTNEGWGKDINLAQCSQEEKDLGAAKENLQTVYVGEYCKKDPLGICLEHRKAYCVFPSKLARIVQAQGRRDQLGIGFGDPENVNCRGLSREEFAQLDLSKMDFSDFYAEITKKEHIEDPGKLNQRVSEKTSKWAEEKKPNG
ncbi:MAG TPA: type-F conjugative transfer system mating-pair stabilization protein TraN [Candidatus Babeliales bacterium]|nr:type-F conjugative transfer system mating-pair stabilization protein TraN [Candidatus Babeliales bacterium]